MKQKQSRRARIAEQRKRKASFIGVHPAFSESTPHGGRVAVTRIPIASLVEYAGWPGAYTTVAK